MRLLTKKKVTIITVCLASDLSVLDTYESIKPQLTNDVEWVIKNSEPVAAEKLQALAIGASIKVVNQKDSGIYQAINQALEQASGEYCWVIGAGDLLLPGAIQTVLEAIAQAAKMTEIDAICFPIYHKKLNAIVKAEPRLFSTNMSCPHPGALLKTEHVKELNGYDERYEIAADYDLMLRYFEKWRGVAVGSVPIVEFQGGGISEIRINEAALESDLSRARFARKKRKMSET